jgi:hypothetical protein
MHLVNEPELRLPVASLGSDGGQQVYGVRERFDY